MQLVNGSLTFVLVELILLEEEESRVASDAELLANAGVGRLSAVDCGDVGCTSFVSQLLPSRSKPFAVATPRSEELDEPRHVSLHLLIRDHLLIKQLGCEDDGRV